MPLNSLRIENFSVLGAGEYKTPSYRENAQNTPLERLYVNISWGELFLGIWHDFILMRQEDSNLYRSGMNCRQPVRADFFLDNIKIFC